MLVKKDIRKLMVLPILILILIISCEPLPEPIDQFYHITYDVSGDISEGDIVYTNETLQKVEIEAESLPWTISFDVPINQSITLHIGAEIDPTDILIPVATGISTSSVEYELNDTSQNFLSLVEASDSVFLTSDIGVGDIRVKVDEVLSDTSLALVTDFITASGLAYSIYRSKDLTLTITVDDEVFATNTITDIHHLSGTVTESLGHRELPLLLDESDD